ncbi:MAG: hypothetical protein ACRD4I_07690, partial [Candidatus Angelobacter sp.]
AEYNALPSLPATMPIAEAMKLIKAGSSRNTVCRSRINQPSLRDWKTISYVDPALALRAVPGYFRPSR